MPRSSNPVPQYFTDQNKILVGGKMFYFEAGTNDPKPTFANKEETIQNPHPVVLDGEGRLPDVFFSDTAKQVLKDSNLVQIWERDDVSGGIDSFGLNQLLINDLSQAYEFNTVAAYKAFTTAFPVGKTIKLLDRQAEFSVLSGTGTADEFGVIASSIVSQSIGIIIKDGVFNVVEFGAIGDDVTDDYLPIQAANVAAVEAANAINGGATILYPPRPYFVTGTVSPLPAGENTLDRYNTQQGGGNVGRVENIKIRGYGATLRSATATFTPSYPFCMMTLILAPKCSVKGLTFESDMNNKIPEWFDSGNYFNRAVPAIKGEGGLYAVRCSDLKVQDNSFLHMEVACVLTDNRSGAHPDEMETYRTDLSGNRFFNCWTGLSMSNGSLEEWLIHHNSFQYTFIKTASVADRGRGIQFTNNMCRDISGILFAASDTLIENNTFNNLLGGFSFQPQGLAQLEYNYNIENMKLRGNICYSDHETIVDDGAATIRPQGFVTFNAAVSGTGAQQVEVIDFECSGNSVDLWPLAGNSTGAFMLRTGDADILFDSPNVTNNVCTANNNLGALVTMAAEASFSDTSFKGTFRFNNNKFTRTISGNAAFDFQFMSGTFNDQATLEFNGNNLITLGTNRQIVVGNFNKFIANNNNMLTEEGPSSTNTTFWTRSVPKVEIDQNEIAKLSPSGNKGYILYYDGITSGTYDSVLDSAVVRLSQNSITSGSSTFNSPLTFPASAHGLYEFESNIIRNQSITSDYPNITGFPSENVANPSRLTPPTTGVTLPRGYIVRPYNNTGDKGWHWSGVWTSMGTF